MEIRLDEHLVTTTMRTPGHDYELAVGFCFAEGLLAGAPVQTVRYCATGTARRHRVQRRHRRDRRPGADPRPGSTTTTSSCGWCGSRTIDELRDRLHPLVDATAIDARRRCRRSPTRAQAAQELFERDRRGARRRHVRLAAARSALVREDIGRHNAVDKVVGRLLLDGALPGSRPRPVRQRPGVASRSCRRRGRPGSGRRWRSARRRRSRSRPPAWPASRLAGFARPGRPEPLRVIRGAVRWTPTSTGSRRSTRIGA